MQPGERHGKIRVVGVVALALLTLVGLGYSVYAWSQSQRQLSIINDKSAQIDSLNKEVASLQSTVNDLKEAESTEPTAVADKDAAQATAQLYLDAQVLDTKYVATVTKVEGNFASANVSPADRPGSILSGIYLKKVNGTWIVVWQGSNGPDKATGDRFGLPKDWYSQQ